MSRLPMISGASKMVFDPSRCNQSSKNTGSTLAAGDPQVSIPESGLAGLVCFSSVSFFSRQGFLAS